MRKTQIVLLLDNLTISKDPDRTLLAFIANAVENGGDDSKGSERGLEYDTMSVRFARFINDEVLLAVPNNAKIKAAHPNIAFTKNPWGKAAMGCSSGGAAAPTNALSCHRACILESAALQVGQVGRRRHPCWQVSVDVPRFGKVESQHDELS